MHLHDFLDFEIVVCMHAADARVVQKAPISSSAVAAALPLLLLLLRARCAWVCGGGGGRSVVAAVAAVSGGCPAGGGWVRGPLVSLCPSAVHRHLPLLFILTARFGRGGVLWSAPLP